ncbi:MULTISPECIES: peptidoglycan-binding protein [Streptomyces]|uniref:Spore cortex-lytic enzyme n=1 Tax=Streptomyces chartreusis NRRL 3882 TaxID=1079985 RepID=A0A2N9B9G4_STRCX|nr:MULTISPECIES: peptidoglycan-binding protein [Streptomyces]MYS93494.1 helix-turn-helix domain-containing protein [Streptomyces sp. SID5464]SOR79971.1 spore cortex-lytic enzyme [Streptomyces chartreusis NRRL 3882]
MSRWKGLPEELDPCVRQLVVRLRRVKDHSGLSLRQLAAKTGYSTSSWERYLAGRSLPPREAVEAMARLGGDDPTRLLALHEVATEAWGKGAGHADPADLTDRADRPDRVDRQGETAGTEPGTDTPRPHGRALRITLIAGSVALVLAVAATVLLAVRLTDGQGRAVAAGLTASATTAPGSPEESERTRYTCRADRIDGRWYAGNSRTMKAILAKGHAGPEVAEAQCLLREAGLSPGVVDGIFGPHTERAVRDLQKRARLVVDGIIGPHTWKALRE